MESLDPIYHITGYRKYIENTNVIWQKYINPGQPIKYGDFKHFICNEELGHVSFGSI